MNDCNSKSVKINHKSLKFIKDLVKEIKNQDNRATASPYYYVIEDEEIRGVPDGAGDKTMFMWDGDLCAAEDVQREYPNVDLDDIEFHTDGIITPFDVVTARYIPYNSNVFLTEKACHQHMESNAHHFKNPRSYVMHAFRNPELEQLLKVLTEIAEND